MPTFTRCEDIEAWQKARMLCREVYVVSRQGLFARDFGLRDQIRRASVSSMSNIAEGFDRSGAREFIQFLAMAKGSAGEVRSQLYVGLDQGYLSETDFERLSAMAVETGKLIGGLMQYLRKASIRGSKYKKAKS